RFPAPQPTVCSYPKIALAVFKCTSHSVTKSAILPIALDDSVPNCAQLPRRRKRITPNPYCAFTILNQGEDSLVPNSGVKTEFPVLPACEALFGSDPKRPIVRGEQT